MEGLIEGDVVVAIVTIAKIGAKINEKKIKLFIL
jgi:hypothetical protein